MFDRSILRSQRRRVIVKCLAAAQALEDVLDRSRVGMELSNAPADVLLARIPEQIQLRLVDPDENPAGIHPMKSDGAVLDEILELLRAGAQTLDSTSASSARLAGASHVLTRSSCFPLSRVSTCVRERLRRSLNFEIGCIRASSSAACSFTYPYLLVAPCQPAHHRPRARRTFTTGCSALRHAA